MISSNPIPGARGANSLAWAGLGWLGWLGWAGLGNTYFWIDPSKGVAGVILMQLLPFADKQALAALQ